MNWGPLNQEQVMDGTIETLLLPEMLDIAASDGFLDQIRQSVTEDAPLRLDASAVRILTLPCVQIIISAIRSGADVRIKDPSAAFAGAFEDFGIDWMQYLDRSAPAIAGDDLPAVPADEVTLQPVAVPVLRKRILTIDDSKTMRDMLMLTLDEAGFEVIAAVDGQDGLDVLAQQTGLIDVIITDINMPRMDGYEVIRNLRRDPAHKSTPILVLTTESDGDKKNMAREAGATGWMVKPFDPERLVATVRKVAP